MNYEKAYKAVLETATQWIKDGCTDKEKICLESVFPELRESEDERIIKFLKHAATLDAADELFQEYGVKHTQVIAWLEKQKEQKPAEKPSMLELLREHLVNTPKEQLDAEFEALKDLTIDKPAEWSEEDEEMLNNIEYILHKDISYTPPTKPNSCTGSGNAYYTHQTEIDWLKSLRSPKSSDNWKPSEEQMKALLNAEGYLREGDQFDSAKSIAQLYEQLKAIKEDRR